jgi:uncharacterized membrane protein (UPF0127 family)
MSYNIALAAALAIFILVIAVILMLKTTPARFCFGEKCFGGELADNAVKKTLGMMFRSSMPDDYGMVFPMGLAGRLNNSFWMQNVKFPLELICVKGGTVTEIIMMETCDKTNGCVHYAPKGEIDYAIEASVGFSERNGVAKGMGFRLQ